MLFYFHRIQAVKNGCGLQKIDLQEKKRSRIRLSSEKNRILMLPSRRRKRIQLYFEKRIRLEPSTSYSRVSLSLYIPGCPYLYIFQGVPISIYSRVSLTLYIPGCPYLYIFQGVPNSIYSRVSLSLYIPGCPYLYILQGVPISIYTTWKKGNTDRKPNASFQLSHPYN